MIQAIFESPAKNHCTGWIRIEDGMMIPRLPGDESGGCS
jgi:hypothetical protein